MKQPELPLYPKISSIYNKIMQLAIAIVFIIILLNLWLTTGGNDKALINKHFTTISHQYLQQAGLSVQVLFANKKNDLLQQYLRQLTTMPYVKTVHLYDDTGQVIFHARSENSITNGGSTEVNLTAENTINDLYGISPEKMNRSDKYRPFVQELRTDKLLGYLRITIEKSTLDASLIAASDERQQLIRLMIVMAGVVGFLLTRGFNRFSRQGYRLRQAS